MGLLPGSDADTTRKMPLTPSGRRWLAAAFVLLVAFFFNFYRLADYPLGIWFDPAYNGLDSLRLMQRGGHVIFFPTNGGRESLFMYLLIPFIWVFGAVPFSMRALTASLGVLHVAFTFGFLYDLPSLMSPDSRVTIIWRRIRIWVAALGGLVLASSYWHIVISRRGQRPMLVPLLTVALFWFFLKGWRTGERKWFLLAGLVMGLAGYSYGAARLMPVILGLAFLPELWRLLFNPARSSYGGGDRSPGAIWTNLLIFVGVGVLVFLPMGWYFLNHTAQFSARASSVMVWAYLSDPAQIAAELGQNTGRVLAFFCCKGSPNPSFGLPGFPGLTPLLAPFLAMGLLGAVLNGRQLEHRLLALWWIIGILPSILAIEAPQPLRMIVAVTPTAALVALSPVYMMRWLRSSIDNPGQGQERPFAVDYLPQLLMLVVVFYMQDSFRAYFVEWEKLAETRDLNDYAAVALRDEVLARDGEGAVLYLPTSRFNDAPLLFYLGGRLEREAAVSVPASASEGEQIYAIAPDTDGAEASWVRIQDGTVTVLPPLTAEGQQIIFDALGGSQAREISAVDGTLAGYEVPLNTDPGSQLYQPVTDLEASFGPMKLTGASYPESMGELEAEPAVPMLLYWQAAQTMKDEYEVLVRLVDDQRRAWGNGDGRPTDWVYPTSFWRPGQDHVADLHQVSIDPSQLPPPGRYWLAVSVFDPATGRRLPLTAAQSESPDTLFIGPLKIPLTTEQPQPGAEMIEAGARFGDVATLIGITAEGGTVNAGQELSFNLVWEALAAADLDYTVFVHLIDSDGNMVAGSDGQPVHGSYPSSIWDAGEVIVDPRRISTVGTDGENLPAGSYRLAVGLYDLASGERLPVWLADGQPSPQQEYVLDQVLRIEP